MRGRSLVYVAVGLAAALAGCSPSQEISAETTCLDYVAFSDDERASAVRVIGAEVGWRDASSPIAGVNSVDAACGSFSNPSGITIGTLMEQWAIDAGTGRQGNTTTDSSVPPNSSATTISAIETPSQPSTTTTQQEPSNQSDSDVRQVLFTYERRELQADGCNVFGPPLRHSEHSFSWGDCVYTVRADGSLSFGNSPFDYEEWVAGRGAIAKLERVPATATQDSAWRIDLQLPDVGTSITQATLRALGPRRSGLSATGVYYTFSPTGQSFSNQPAAAYNLVNWSGEPINLNGVCAPHGVATALWVLAEVFFCYDPGGSTLTALDLGAADGTATAKWTAQIPTPGEPLTFNTYVWTPWANLVIAPESGDVTLVNLISGETSTVPRSNVLGPIVEVDRLVGFDPHSGDRFWIENNGFLAEVDSAGNEIWSFEHNGTGTSCAATDTPNGFLFIGCHNPAGQYSRGVILDVKDAVALPVAWDK